MAKSVDFFVKFCDDEGTIIIEKFRDYKRENIDGKTKTYLNNSVIFYGDSDDLARRIENAIINNVSFLDLTHYERTDDD